jgi:hypothetical protein
MGADFVCAVVALKNKKNGDNYVPTKKTIDKVIKDFVPTEEELSEFEEEFSMTKEEVGVIFFKETTTHIVNEFFDCFTCRDVGTLCFKKFYLIISGGMTHGEPPTDSYELIHYFSRLPWRLQEQLGAYDG